MEKYSDFNDPFTGINPFVNLHSFKITVFILIKAIIHLPIYLFTYLNLNTIPYFIKINLKQTQIKGLIACNCSSIFDKYILNSTFNLPIFYLTKTGFLDLKGKFNKNVPKDAIIFVEGINSNNRCLLKFVRNIKVDYVVGLTYSPGCIYMHGSYFKFLINFLAYKHNCKIQVKKSDDVMDLLEVCNLPQTEFGIEDRIRFDKLINKK